MMTSEVQALRDLLKRLEDVGVKAAIVGGAARDAYLGRVPKDYDLVILSHTCSDDMVPFWIEQAAGYPVTNLSPQDSESYAEVSERGLLAVYELGGGLTDSPVVQFLLFEAAVMARYAGDPYNVVDDHDCDLNQAWFEDAGGRLVPRVTASFPSPFTGNVNNFRPGYRDTTRMDYMREKFPEYNHK